MLGVATLVFVALMMVFPRLTSAMPSVVFTMLLSAAMPAGALLAIIFGLLARRAVSRSPGRRKGTRLALSGVVFGLAALSLVCAAIVSEFRFNRLVEQHVEDAFDVLQLSEDVAVGQLITSGHINVVKVPIYFKDAFRDAMPAVLIRTLIGRRAPKNLHRHRIILIADLSKDIENIVVPEGMSLITIPVDERASPGALLRVGNHVDILGAFDFRSGKELGLRTEVVMRQVEVRAVDGRRWGAADECRRISIIVSREDAKTLAGLNKILIGDYVITIQNPKETLKEDERGINPLLLHLLKSLRGGGESPVRQQ